VLAAFAGHGIQPEGSKEAYFCPYDADQAVFDHGGKKVADWDLDNAMLPLSEVIVSLRASGAEAKAILVDACRNDPKTGRGRGFGTEFKCRGPAREPGVAPELFPGERAWEDKHWDHGAFFHHVLKGIRDGKGAVEGHVTANSLAAYVSRAVRSDVPAIIGGGATQRPHAIINGEVDFLVELDVPAKPEMKVEPRAAARSRSLDLGGGVKLDLVYIPAGTCTMGSDKSRDPDAYDDELPAHESRSRSRFTSGSTR